MSEKPFSQACENNKQPIYEILTKQFDTVERVLEIGSGTGQHGVFFAEKLAHVFWQTADQPEYHDGICAWIEDAGLSNIGSPINIRFPSVPWKSFDYDAVFTANTAHIMQKEAVESMMTWVAEHLPPGGRFCQYGPFIQDGQFSSQSNEDFHHYLVSEGYGGYRHIEELVDWASPLTLEDIVPMPANNLMLIWHKPQ